MNSVPPGWKWLRAGDVILETQYGLSLSTSSDGNIPIIGMKDLVDGRVADINLPCVSISDKDAAPYLLREGDLLLNRTNSPHLVGKIGYVDKSLDAVFASYLVRLKPDTAIVDSRFLAYWLGSSRGQEEIRPLITRGVSQANINPTAFCQRVAVPVPPLNEQRRIADLLTTWDRSIVAAERARDRVEQFYLGVANRSILFRSTSMCPLGDVLTPDRMKAVEVHGPFRALGVRSHGKGTFQRTDDLTALDSDKTVYRIEPGRFVVNIVFAWEGAAAITSAEDEGCLVSHRFPTLTINEDLLFPDYFRHMIRMKRFRHLLALASPGGAGRNKTLNRHDLLGFEVHIPSLAEQHHVAELLSTLDRKFRLLARYVDALKSQRDALAQELLTGRRRTDSVSEGANEASYL